MKKIIKHERNKRVKKQNKVQKKKIRRKKQSNIYYSECRVADGIKPRPGYYKL